MEFNLDISTVFTFSRVSLNVFCDHRIVLADCAVIVSLLKQLLLERFDLGCRKIIKATCLKVVRCRRY